MKLSLHTPEGVRHTFHCTSHNLKVGPNTLNANTKLYINSIPKELAAPRIAIIQRISIAATVSTSMMFSSAIALHSGDGRFSLRSCYNLVSKYQELAFNK